MDLFPKRKTRNQRFKELVYPHVTFLYNMALRYVRNTYDAEDMVQETLYIGLTKFHQLRDITKCKSWLFAILRSIYLKELRIRSQKHAFEYDECENYITLLEEAAESFDTGKAFEKNLDDSQLHRIVDNLPEKYKSPILLYYMEDMTYQEISEYLDIPVGTVMSRLSRAKEFVKKEMLRALNINSAPEKVVELRKFQKSR